MLVVFSTFPDAETARRIARTLVEENLAACVNILPDVESYYRWEGKVCAEGELLAIIKLRANGFAALESRLTELHPYEVPEIVALPLAAVNPAYLAWVKG